MVHLHVIGRGMPLAKADLVPVWVGTRVLLAHGDPYSAETTRQIQSQYYGHPLRPSDHVDVMRFAYPAQTAVLFAPFAILAFHDARIVFLLCMLPLTAATVPVWMSAVNAKATRSQMGVVTLLFLGSWPAAWGFRLLQPTMVVAVLVAAGCWLLRRDHGIAAGVLLALAMIKPQLVGPLVLWLALWATRQRVWRFLVSFVLASGLLQAIAWWLRPEWWIGWREAAWAYAHYPGHTSVLEQFLGPAAGKLLGVALLLCSSFALWKMSRCSRQDDAFGASIALALSVTVAVLPTILPMLYNDVLLLPALLVLMRSRPASRVAGAMRLAAFSLVIWSFLAEIISGVGDLAFGPSSLLDALPFMILPLPPVLALALLLHLSGARRDQNAQGRKRVDAQPMSLAEVQQASSYL